VEWVSDSGFEGSEEAEDDFSPLAEEVVDDSSPLVVEADVWPG